jgi:tripartite-type tricarboxylate transporter receptor subunit TctC
MTDLLGGQVSMMFATAAAVSPHIASGKLRALAVTSAERSAVMKSIPAIAETVRGYALESWYGLFAPAGTPSDVIAKLNAAAKQAAQSLEFRQRLESEGLAVSTGTPQELEAYVKREEARWRKIVKENNIKPD